MEQQLLDEETGSISQVTDLLSSLFGQHITSNIINNNTKDHTKTCPHPMFINKICTKCGLDNNNGIISTISLWYIYPQLCLSLEEINHIRDKNLQAILTRKKLHLVLDLDHTLVHTRKLYKLTPEDRKFLGTKKYGIHYNAQGEECSLFKIGDGWTKLRPFVRNFLREASKMFDMTIYTLGCRPYAWSMVKLLDSNGACFDQWRVISRDDCVLLDKHKKCLDIVLEHEKVVVVMDDNEDVWEDYKGNLLRVIPYNFFSYSSPMDRDHDTSPPRESWSQLGGDESEENGVLAKALEKLRMVYEAFYDDDSNGKGSKGYGGRDVRPLIQRVWMNQRVLGKKEKMQKGKKISS